MNELPGNLRTFRILFIVQGILVLLFSFLFVFYIIMGNIFYEMDRTANTLGTVKNAGVNPGSIIMTIGIIGFIICATIGSLTLVASQRINQLKGYTFIFVVAIINCLTGILGILLCVFTLIEITKPHIKGRFEGKEDVVFEDEGPLDDI